MLASLPWVQPVPPAMEDCLDLFSQVPVALPAEFNPVVGTVGCTQPESAVFSSWAFRIEDCGRD